jgi:glycosyltransferase involved in cell wall biosynthesis
MKLISILIPAFNAEQWISDTIESALAQTWPNKEIIVVDDGSADETLSIAQSFAPAGVSVVSQTNQGAAGARNKAFSRSHGDYIQWLDADDLLAPDKIAKQMEAVERCQSQRTLFSSAWAPFMYRQQRANFSPTALWCDLSPVEWLLRKLEQNLYMQTSTWLVSRELTQAAGPWDTRLLGDDDGEYFCRVKLASDSIRFIPESKVFYRISGPGSLSYIGRSNKRMDAQLLSMELHVNYVRSLQDSPRVRAACLQFLQRWVPQFYPERVDIVKKMEQLAEELGGRIEHPKLSWKYAWIQKLFGSVFAKRTQILLPRLKLSLLRSWDHALYRLEH